MDFLGLNDQMQAEPLPHEVASAASAAPNSWLLEVQDSAPIDLAPPRATSPAHSPAAASLLNASWREEQAPKRRPRWLAPVAVGAALAVVAMIGLPKLRQEAHRDPALGAIDPPSDKPDGGGQGPAAPTSSTQIAEEERLAETTLDPVAPDPQLDRVRPERVGRNRDGLARNTTSMPGRTEAPMNAPGPGESFVAPVEVFDPAGVWSVQPIDSETHAGAEGDVETAEPVDGVPGATSRATGADPKSEAHAALEGECEAALERRLPPDASVDVDWDRLVWLARAADSGVAQPSTPLDSAGTDAPASKAKGRKRRAAAHEEAVARALLAWSGAGEATEDSPAAVEVASVAPPEASAPIPEPIPEPMPQPLGPVETASTSSEVALDSRTPIEHEGVEPVSPAVEEVATEALPRVVEELVAPSPETVESAQLTDAAAAPIEAPSEPSPELIEPVAVSVAEPTVAPPAELPSSAVRVLARGSRRIAAREEAAARRAARQAESELVDDAVSETSIAATPADSAPLAPAPAEADAAPAPVEEQLGSVESAHLAQIATGETAPVPAPVQQEPMPQEPLAPTVDELPAQALAPLAEPSTAEALTLQDAEGHQAPLVAQATPTKSTDDAVAVAPSPRRAPVSEPEPKRVLKVARPEDLQRIWSGESIPLEAVGSQTQLATPDIGRTRVVFHTGEVFEGELVAIGEGSLWLKTANGRLALDGARVRSVVRIEAGASSSRAATTKQKLAGLPRARVQTPGGTLHGRVLERDETRTTLVTDSGARIVLDSRMVELASDRPLVQIRP